MRNFPDYERLLYLFDECLSAHYRHVELDASFAVKRVNNSVTVFFQDSNGKADWKHNLAFAARPYRHMGEVFCCHRGFLAVFRAALPYLKSVILDPDIQSFTVVGYSHGAALALLCHEYIWFHRPDVASSLEGYGFGCPRVINGCMTRSLSKRWENFYPIRNIDDIVTHLPPRFLGYCHVKEPLLIGRRGKYSVVDAHRPENYRRELLFAAKISERKDLLYDQ